MIRTDVFAVGIDVGGTWIRVAGLDREGREIFFERTPTVIRSLLPGALRRLIGNSRLKPQKVVVASRGIWTASERDKLIRDLRGLAPNIRAISDVEAAWHAAFENATRPLADRPSGVLVVAGTGSIALGRGYSRPFVRAGGLGPLLGDEGSAYWMGREWIKSQANPLRPGSALVRLGGRPAPVARIANLAKSVLTAALRGHREARGIVREAQQHLARLLWQPAAQLRLTSPILLSWAGSLFRNEAFLKGMQREANRLFKSHSRRTKWVSPSTDAARAAAWLAFHG